MEQVAHQAFSPNSSNRWALRSKINYNHYNYNFELCFYISVLVYESTSQVPLGLHQPNFSNKQAFGLFDQCLAVRAENEKTLTNFRGKYCTVYFRPVQAVLENSATILQSGHETIVDDLLKIIEVSSQLKAVRTVAQVADTEYTDSAVSRSSGYCLPSSCSAADVRQAVADLVGVFGLADEYDGTFVSIQTVTDESQCYVDSEETDQLDSASYAVL